MYLPRTKTGRRQAVRIESPELAELVVAWRTASERAGARRLFPLAASLRASLNRALQVRGAGGHSWETLAHLENRMQVFHDTGGTILYSWHDCSATSAGKSIERSWNGISKDGVSELRIALCRTCHFGFSRDLSRPVLSAFAGPPSPRLFPLSLSFFSVV